MNAINQHLSIVVCKDAQEAVEKGFNYHEPEYLPVRIKEVVVIQKGTTSGNPTVDLILEDEKGQKYVTLVTGNLLKALPL